LRFIHSNYETIYLNIRKTYNYSRLHKHSKFGEVLKASLRDAQKRIIGKIRCYVEGVKNKVYKD